MAFRFPAPDFPVRASARAKSPAGPLTVSDRWLDTGRAPLRRFRDSAWMATDHGTPATAALARATDVGSCFRCRRARPPPIAHIARPTDMLSRIRGRPDKARCAPDKK